MVDPTILGTHRVDVGACIATHRRRLKRTFALQGALIALVFLGMTAHSLFSQGVPPSMALLVLGIAGCVTAPIMLLGWRLQIRRMMREADALRSYELTLREGTITRTMDGLPLLVLSRGEVTRISEHPEKGVTLETAEPDRFLLIPKQLERYEQARASVIGWGPIEKPTLTPPVAREWIFGIAMLGAWAGTLLLPDMQLATFTGALFVVLSVRALRNVWRSIQLDRRTKVRISLMFALMSITPLGRLALYAVYGVG
jgi:hypothetical protein